MVELPEVELNTVTGLIALVLFFVLHNIKKNSGMEEEEKEEDDEE